jgi:uncharacterized protein (DUF736 family)
MANIGTFTKTSDGSYTGAIHTLGLNVKSVQFRPIEQKTHPKGPDFRVMAGRAELGAAWKPKAEDARDFLSVRLDDPSFPARIDAVLVDAEEGYNLIWSRERKQRQAKAETAEHAD